MNDFTSLSVQYGFIALSLICIALILTGLWNVLTRMAYPPKGKRRITAITIFAITGWLIFISVLSFTDVARDFSSFPPPLMPLLMLPPLVAALILTFSKRLDQILLHLPAQWLIGLQSFRVGVEILLWACFIRGLLPVQMTFEGMNFDVITGMTAPLVAFIAASGSRWRNPVLWWWNTGGLLLLFTIVAVSVLSMPTPIRLFTNEPANTIISTFPFIWLPGILVPVAYTMHLFSMRQLSLRGKPKPADHHKISA